MPKPRKKTTADTFQNALEVVEAAIKGPLKAFKMRTIKMKRMIRKPSQFMKGPRRLVKGPRRTSPVKVIKRFK